MEEHKQSHSPSKKKRAVRNGILTGLAAILVAFGLAYLLFFPSAVLTFVDAATGDPLADITVSIDNTEYTTNQDGQITYKSFYDGLHEVSVSLEGYETYDDGIHLRYGQTLAKELELEQVVAGRDVELTVRNYISEDPIDGATVTINGDAQTTNADGTVTLTVPDDATVNIIASGYNDLDVAATELGEVVDLVPQGTIIFVSNRDDGKRGLYSATFDGSEVEPLIERVGDTEDYGPVQSPDADQVAFLSTRDEQTTRYGSDSPRLYVVNADGSGVQKLSDRGEVGGLTWSHDSSYLYWVEGDSDDTVRQLKRYSVARDTVDTLAEMQQISDYFVVSDDGAKVAFTGRNEGTYSAYHLFAMNNDGSDLRSSAYGASSFRFNADNNIEFSQYSGEKKDYTFFADSGAVEESVHEESPERRYYRSPDGTQAVFVERRDGKSELYLVDEQLENEDRLTNLHDVTTVQTPYWTQNSEYIIFPVVSNSETALYVVSPSGADAKKITDATLSDYYGYY